MITIISCILIFNVKIFHAINFHFVRKNENILTTKKDGSMVVSCIVARGLCKSIQIHHTIAVFCRKFAKESI